MPVPLGGGTCGRHSGPGFKLIVSCGQRVDGGSKKRERERELRGRCTALGLQRVLLRLGFLSLVLLSLLLEKNPRDVLLLRGFGTGRANCLVSA